MINVYEEHLVPLEAYTRLRPPGRNGKPMHISTAYRHVFRGVRGVKLEVVRIGGCLLTSREAVQRFVEALSAPSSSPHPDQGPVERRRSDAQAALECARIGL